MIDGHFNEGWQDMGQPLQHGVSVPDAYISIAQTVLSLQGSLLGETTTTQRSRGACRPHRQSTLKLPARSALCRAIRCARLGVAIGSES